MAWFVRRIAMGVLQLWAVVTIVFFSVYLIPGDPAEIMLSAGEASSGDTAAVDTLREKLGLNQPIVVQYVDKITALMRFDLGNSMVSGTPIADDIALRLPRTLELIGAAALISLLIGIPSGVAAALYRGRLFDRIASLITGLFQAVPIFVTGTLLVLVFAQILRLVPAGGYVEFSDDPVRHLILLLLPATAVAVGLSATVFRITRASVLEVLPQDYVRTAQAKGLAHKRIVSRHILRNALMPVVTVFALTLGTLLSGTVLVEFVFNWPGLSGMLIRSVHSRDYPSITAILLVTAALFILIHIIVDVIYAWLDPRVRK